MDREMDARVGSSAAFWEPELCFDLASPFRVEGFLKSAVVSVLRLFVRGWMASALAMRESIFTAGVEQLDQLEIYRRDTVSKSLPSFIVVWCKRVYLEDVGPQVMNPASCVRLRHFMF